MKRAVAEPELHFWPQPMIPQNIRDQLRYLNFRTVANGKPSPMREALRKYKRRWDSYVFVLIEGLWHAPTAKVVGWCLITPGRAYGVMRCSFYVPKRQRGKKYGLVLLRAVLTFAKTHNVKMAFWQHDARAKKFFKKYAGAHFDVCDGPVLQYLPDINAWQSPWRHSLRKKKWPKPS